MTVMQWIIQRGQVVQFETYYRAKMDSSACPIEHFPEPAIAVRVGIDYHIPKILPAVFYALAWVEITDDWDRYCRYTWRFGDQSGHGEDEWNPITNMRRLARWSLLDKDTLYQVLLGRAELRNRQENFSIMYSPASQDSGCNNSKACSKTLKRLEREYRTTVSTRHCPGPLETLLELLEHVKGSENLCWNCKDELESEIDTEVNEIWTDLPHSFSLYSIPGFGGCS